jgi:phosphate transport system substrate-binding protein
MFRRSRIPIIAALALALVVAAGAAAFASAPVQGQSGEVVVSGSSTVEPITSLVGEKFSEKNPDVAVRVDGPGTGDGFQLFCNGETDISDASRAIEEEEQQACQANGIAYTELKVGIDGLSVITSKDTKGVSCLNLNDLYALIGPQSQGFNDWQDAQPLATQLGSTTQLPRAKLEITAPGEESGTYDSFVELALGDPAEKQVEAGAITEDQAETTRKDYQSSGNDNTIIDGVAETKNSLGWVGFAFADQNKDKVKIVKVDKGEGDGCVAPSAKTVRDGSYPLSRDLYIYVNNAKAASNPAVKSFVDYYMGKNGNASVKEADYIQLAKADWTQSVDTWKATAQSLG